MPCTVHSLEGKRLILLAAQRMPASTPVTIQCGDVMFLGDIVRSSREAEDAWHIEIKVQQMLTGLQNLMNLRARLLEDGSGQRPAMMPVMVPMQKSVRVSPF